MVLRSLRLLAGTLPPELTGCGPNAWKPTGWRPNGYRLLPAVLLASGLLACGEEAPTAIDPPQRDVPNLSLAMPLLDADGLTAIEIDAVGERPPSVEPNAVGPWLTEDEDEKEGPAEIFGARTRVGFEGKTAYAEGFHRFTGNGGRIETTANVTFEGNPVGSQTAILQRSWWLTLDTRHFLTAYAPVYTENACGLRVTGHSLHQAWLELFNGRSAPRWGHAVQSSTGGPASQSPCRRKVVTDDPSGLHETPAGLVCYYLVTYDLDTLEVLNVQFLSCESGGGYGDHM